MRAAVSGGCRSRAGRAAAACLGLVAGCAGGDARDQSSSIGSCLVNGGDQASYLRLDGSEENAIVRIDVGAPASGGDDGNGNSASSGATCSGVLVAPGWVLTARHCAPTTDATDAVVAFGQDARSGVAGALPCAAPNDPALAAPAAPIRLRGARIVRHPELDLMLIQLDTAWPVAALEVTPIPVGGDDALAVGALAQLAGVGYTELGGGPGLRRFVVEEIVALDGGFATVDGHGRSGLCSADSGGPLLVRADGGRAFTAGILNGGSADCLGQDAFTRLGGTSGAAAWVSQQIEQPPAAAPAPCTALGTGGRCFGALAAWCDRGTLRGELCGGSTGCGWSARDGGFRCVAAADDPCGGVSDVGICDELGAVRCDDGLLVRTSCSDCARSPQAGTAICTSAGP